MRPVHVALAVLVAAVWGLNFVVIEVGLEDFPPLLLSALRYRSPRCRCCSSAAAPGVPWKWVLAVGGAIGVVKFSLLFVGMDIGMPAGLASLVLQMQAFFTVGFAVVLLGERPQPRSAAGLALATAGLALVAGGLDGARHPGRLRARHRRGRGVGHRQRRHQARRAAGPAALHDLDLRGPAAAAARALARVRGPAEIGDALAGIDLGGIAAVAYIAFAATTVGWGLWAYLLRHVLGRHRRPVLAPRARSSGSASRRCCSTSRSALARSSPPSSWSRACY